MNPAIQIRDLEVRKSGKRICFVPELDIQAGDRLAVTGPNGSGKTTLLRVLMGLESYEGQCQVSIPPEKRVYVHQQPYLFRGSVRFNAAYGGELRRLPRDERAALSLHWLDLLGVKHLADRRCETLSGGEKRRVALARAFALGRDLLLLDEPLAELDDGGIACVMRALEESPATIIIATPSELPAGFCSSIYKLEKRD